MAKVIRNPKSKDSDAVAAFKDLADRAGFKPHEKHEVMVKSPKDMTTDELREWADELGSDHPAAGAGEDPPGD